MEIKIEQEDLLELLVGHANWSMAEETFSAYCSAEMIKKYSTKLTIDQKQKLVKQLNKNFKEKRNLKDQNNKVWETLLLYFEKFPL